MKRLLMIAYHFPPLAGSSGIQRTLRLVQQLPQFGWQPLVLTVRPEAYERCSDDMLADVPAGTVVKRSFALDASRDLAIKGRYIGALARPDRWMSWRWFGVGDAMRLIREHKADAIWSTYPIASAHSIGAAVQARSGLPWVADFRDPMAQPDYPPDPITRQKFLDIEARIAAQAALMTFTTPSALRDYQGRYSAAASRMALLENGYDEGSFAGAENQPRRALNDDALTLLHSGIVYPWERDPTQLMAAMRLLLDRGVLQPGKPARNIKLRFRASVHDDLIQRLAAEHGVSAHVETLPPVGYKDALAEMLNADGLMLLQADNCNAQIPAKAYEYLRAGRPIFCLTDRAGDTAAVLRKAGVQSQFQLNEAEDIARGLSLFLDEQARQRELCADAAGVAQASRLARTREFAAMLDGLVKR
ncbi:glycosyltransferase [Paucibacter sp. APW11]|uniref:Glycosyltransferase n=1 Tax=Roseateles aquae TaxID=3077235 RepID=A0ABU3P5T0_9BURK|nr:glycosyltransferase [Paucibacter sp. APW11]MDT8997932.1 glycosyltransferase [Paucibacter sp. APW11]